MATITAETRPTVIVLGNEKGGSGKSTTAIHVVIGLMRDGYRVGALDLDARQGTLAGTLAARQHFITSKSIPLPMPAFASVHRSTLDNRLEAEAEERARFDAAFAEMATSADIVVIDCPGADTYLSRYGHSHADTLITPINDSFVDFSMLAKVDPDNHDIVQPSIYSEMVWEARKNRFSADRGRIDWIVMRNRLAASEAPQQTRRRLHPGIAGQTHRLPHPERLRRTRHLPRTLFAGPNPNGRPRSQHRHRAGHVPRRRPRRSPRADLHHQKTGPEAGIGSVRKHFFF